jgi:peptidoglycan hydrolase CwlO-like protein
MKKKLLTASVCMLWAPLFVFAGQDNSGQAKNQEKHEQQQISKTVSQCKQAQQALDDANTMLQNESNKPSGASQSSINDIQKTVQQAKSHLDACTSNLENMQQMGGGGSSSGSGGGQ